MEAIIVGLDTARRDERLLESLHSFNDWIQMSLMQLTDELAQAFFGHIRETEIPAPAPASQSQSQTMAAN